MDIEQLSALLISSAGLVLIYNGLYYSLRFPKRISIGFAVTTSLVTFLYLAGNPEVLRDIRALIALAVVTLILAILSIIRNRQ